MSIGYECRRRSTEEAASIHELRKKTVLADDFLQWPGDKQLPVPSLVCATFGRWARR